MKANKSDISLFKIIYGHRKGLVEFKVIEFNGNTIIRVRSSGRDSYYIADKKLVYNDCKVHKQTYKRMYWKKLSSS